MRPVCVENRFAGIGNLLVLGYLTVGVRVSFPGDHSQHVGSTHMFHPFLGGVEFDDAAILIGEDNTFADMLDNGFETCQFFLQRLHACLLLLRHNGPS